VRQQASHVSVRLPSSSRQETGCAKSGTTKQRRSRETAPAKLTPPLLKLVGRDLLIKGRLL
jgi:hypothetical protein